MSDICVVGSANLDLTVRMPALPQPGETVLGGDAVRAPGGKGLNQAVAAARLGRSTNLVCRTGSDDAAALIATTLAAEGVRSAGAIHDDGASGLAVVLVAPEDNAIVVSPGANGRLRGDDVRAAPGVIAGARAVLCQLEIPIDAVGAGAAACTGLFLLNPAPAQMVPPSVLARVDVLIPNAGELARLAGARPHAARDRRELVALARRVLPDGRMVITLGGDGALVVDGDRVEHVAAEPVDVVDPTAAGDTFCAALADGLLAGDSLLAAARWASRAAAITVTRHGAVPALPTRAEVLGSGSRAGSDARDGQR